MLTSRRIFTDLSATSLMNWEQVLLYPHESDVIVAQQQTLSVSDESVIASPLLFDGRLWEAEKHQETVLLRPEVGAVLILPVDHFQHLVEGGQITQGERATPSPLADTARERLRKAGPKELEAANKRWQAILAYFRGNALPVTTRSVQNWLAAFRQAEAELGCGYVGLLDRVARRGNRTPRVLDASRELLTHYLNTHYATPQAKHAAAVYRLYREEAERQGLSPIGERTFYRDLAQFANQQVTTRRQGKRAAYALEPALAYLDQTIM